MPLIKGKSARESLEEQGLWEEYSKRYPYNPMVKFLQSGTEPMTNDADVRTGQQQKDKLNIIYTSSYDNVK